MPRKPSAKTLKAKATTLHSLVVRSRGACERCGERDYSKLQCAHIISRARVNTRTDEMNAFCLCAQDHWFFTLNPVEFGLFVVERIGEDGYAALREKAFADPPRPIIRFWEDEVTRLSALLAEARGEAS